MHCNTLARLGPRSVYATFTLFVFAIIELSIKHSASQNRRPRNLRSDGSRNKRRKPLRRPSFTAESSKTRNASRFAQITTRPPGLLRPSFKCASRESVYCSPPFDNSFFGGSIGSIALKKRRNAKTHACKNQVNADVKQMLYSGKKTFFCVVRQTVDCCRKRRGLI